MRFGREVLQADLYDVLGVERWATQAQIRRAYRALVLRSHPDLDRGDPRTAQRRMAEINVAAGVLLDPARRAAYDRLRQTRRARRSNPPPVYGAGWRTSTTPEDAGDWVVPARARAWARASVEARELLSRLRPWPARLAQDLSERTSHWTPRQHATVMAVSIFVALGLIAEARPSSLVNLFTPEKPAAAVVEPHG